MDPNSLKTMAAAAGAASGDLVYVEDVFSCDVYTGTGSTKAINNGIDLDGEGGMVWIKARSASYDHNIYDTERGATYRLMTNNNSASTAEVTGLTAFNSNGWTTGSSAYTGENNTTYAAYSFRKAEGFFDVVKWDGSGELRTISHNLGCIPGMIIVKKTTDTGSANWRVYHKHMDSSVPEEYFINFDEDGNRVHNASNSLWNDTQPTSSVFTVNTEDGVNGDGSSYVAYLFADGADAAAQIFGEKGDESIIKCGTYEGNDGSQKIDVGWEPQWVLVKNVDSNAHWRLYDNMRGFTCEDGGSNPPLRPNTTDTDASNQSWFDIHINTEGFEFDSESDDGHNKNGDTYIYMAIRRGPMKTAEDATKVFSADHLTNGSKPGYKPGFPVDWGIHKALTGTQNWIAWDRLRGDHELRFNTNDQEQSNNNFIGDNMVGFYDYSTADSTYIGYSFRRAPGFFDIVTYTGTGSANNVPHNLGVVPEMVIVKCRSHSESWYVYHKDLGNTHAGILDDAMAPFDSDQPWNDTSPTSTVFTVNTENGVNGSGRKYVAYLFTSLAGISKVGTYEGTGQNGGDTTINMGFTGSPSFLLIKNGDSESYNWVLLDSTRGLESGKYLRPNLDYAESTGWTGSNEIIENITGGVKILDTAASSAINNSGDTYIYLAIA